LLAEAESGEGKEGAVMRSNRTASLQIADFAVAVDLDEVSGELTAYAKLLIFDALGIALCASSFEFAKRAVLAVRSLSDSEETSTVIGQRR
jgi:2-methylcitrate dehydratase PrpD